MFKLGDTLVFNPSSFNTEYWSELGEEKRIEYYGRFGYGQSEKYLFTFITEHTPQEGHCMLFCMNVQQIYYMCDMYKFKVALEEEC